MLSEKADLDFLEMSRQFPRRKNLVENPVFTTYFQVHPELLPFARQTAHLRGIDCEPNMKEVLDLISQEYEACVVYGLKPPAEGIKDAAHAVDLLYLR
jgi:multiple sugar transport system substrate-binding protein